MNVSTAPRHVPRGGVRERVRPLLLMVWHILVTQAVTAALGYGFWILLSHKAPLGTTGTVSSLISAVTAASMLSSVGIASSLLRGSRDGAGIHEPGAMRAAFVGTMVAASAGALVLVGASPVLLPRLSHGPLGLQALTFVGVIVNAACGMCDSFAMARGRGSIMVVRNIVASALRLGLLVVWTDHPSPATTFAFWVIPLAVSLAYAGPALHRLDAGRPRRPQPSGVPLISWDRVRRWLGHHLTSVGGVGAPLVLPVLTANRLGSDPAGLFYPTWMLAGMFFMISPAIASALLANAPIADRTGQRKLVVTSYATVAGLLAPPAVVCLAAPAFVLRLLGPNYSAHAIGLLVVLVVSTVPDAISNIGVAVLRLRQQFARSASVNAVITAVALGAAWPLMGRYGITGTGLAWLAGQVAGAVAAVVLVGRLGGEPA